MTATEMIGVMRDRIVAKFHPDRIILFGSWARGTALPESDVDLLVVLPSLAHTRRVAVEIRRALRDLPMAKDIVVTTNEELARHAGDLGYIFRPALREGKIIYAAG